MPQLTRLGSGAERKSEPWWRNIRLMMTRRRPSERCMADPDEGGAPIIADEFSAARAGGPGLHFGAYDLNDNAARIASAWSFIRMRWGHARKSSLRSVMPVSNPH
jgi:hypothetical protein